MLGWKKYTSGWATGIGPQSRPIHASEGLNERGLKGNVVARLNSLDEYIGAKVFETSFSFLFLEHPFLRRSLLS
jgi:hypothetical protein